MVFFFFFFFTFTEIEMTTKRASWVKGMDKELGFRNFVIYDSGLPIGINSDLNQNFFFLI